MKKMITLLLALVLALSIIPITALAATPAKPVEPTAPKEPQREDYATEEEYNNAYNKYTVVDMQEYGYAMYQYEQKFQAWMEAVGQTVATNPAVVDQLSKLFPNFDFSNGQFIIPSEKPEDWPATLPDFWNGIDAISPELHEHEFGLTYTRSGHYYACSCGERTAIQAHVDPLSVEDSRCFCGYKFKDNADLTVLWLSGMTLNRRFDPEITEYEATLYTYKDVTKTKVSAKSFDALATVEKPEDLTIKEGTNTFEIKVTAEDGKTTKTYTVTVVKE